MIEANITAEMVPGQREDRVFRITENDRTAGAMPVWGKAKTTKENIQVDLIQTESGDSFADVLAYQNTDESSALQTESFGFGDIIDMVNPLQHIPLVNLAYREITGDQIKPIGKIIGGAVFGGPMGAGSGIVDAIVSKETGRDMVGNAFALARPDQQIERAVKTYERVYFAQEQRTAGSMARFA